MALRLISSISRITVASQLTRSLTVYNGKAKFLPASSFTRNLNFPPMAQQYSTCFPEIATYDEIKKLKSKPKTLLIDVREPNELAETGIVPTSINIPLGQVADKLGKEFSDDDFFKAFNRKKPSKDDEIIFMCKIGRRSHSALEISRQLGYKNGRNFLGSWQEWSNKEGLTK